MYFGPRLFKHMNLDANLFQTRLGLRLILRVFPVICYSYDVAKELSQGCAYPAVFPLMSRPIDMGFRTPW